MCTAKDNHDWFFNFKFSNGARTDLKVENTYKQKEVKLRPVGRIIKRIVTWHDRGRFHGV